MSEKTETPVRVVDASALGALLLGEARAEDVADWLTDAALVAPALLWLEVSSICLRKLKAHPASADAIIGAFNLVLCQGGFDGFSDSRSGQRLGARTQD